MKKAPHGTTMTGALVLLAALAAAWLPGCSDETSTATAPKPEAAVGARDKSRAGDTGLAGDTAPTPDALAEHRPCDNSQSIYTVDVRRAVGAGDGKPTLDEAMGSAIDDAIVTMVELQFKCQLCRNDETCEKYVTGIDRGSAYLESPDADCQWLADDEGNFAWYCFGYVNFSQGQGPPASAKGGCRTCPKLPKAPLRAHYE
ncbi:MAG: hypothetical protein IPK64_18660 [bacterium]|nr:hypothetical protein [bacterium]